MEEHFLRYRTAEQVAAACRVNIFYLCRLYKRFSGLSPYQYLVQLRMKWAANQLHGCDRLIREVADELGIDAFQFSRAFKRVHGVSPTVFLESRRIGHRR
jgi:AraC-like DNA-binding protein